MSRSEEFIQYLVTLSRDEGDGRAKLAALRRGASGESRDLAQVYPIVLPRAPRSVNIQEAYLEAACLFGLHPTSAEALPRAVSLAQAMRRLSDKSDSIEARFLALLQSHREELVGHLRHCIGLAKSNDVLLRWTDVLDALLWWDSEQPDRTATHRVTQQRRWAQEFWGSPRPDDTSEEISAS